MKKRTIIILVLLVLILGGLFFYSLYWNDGEAPISPPGMGADKDNQPEINTSKAKTLIEDIEAKVDDLSPVAATMGGSWHVERVEFVDMDNFYVVYSDGHILRRVLVRKLGEQSPEDYKMVGYFTPGENFWNLEQGEDPYFGESTVIFEKNGESEWGRIN